MSCVFSLARYGTHLVSESDIGEKDVKTRVPVSV